MATVNKPGLARFLQDCGVTLSASEVAPNMLHARTAQTLGEVSAATSKEQERNAQQIAEMIGLFVSPDFGSAGDGVAAVTRVRLDEFKRRIGGRPKAFVAFLVPAARYVEAHYHIPAVVAIAQAAHETGYGSDAAVKTYNLWNLRAYDSWIRAGKKYYDTGTNGKFKDYNNFMEAIIDYAGNYANPRGYYVDAYKKLVAGGTGEQFIRDIANTYAPASDGNSGYAAGVLGKMNEIRQMGFGL